MKVKFRNNHLIFRTSIEEMIGVILEVAKKDGDEDEAVEILKKRGWASEDIKKFDEMWFETTKDVDPSKVQFKEDVYKIARNNMDLTQFWCMK